MFVKGAPGGRVWINEATEESDARMMHAMKLVLNQQLVEQDLVDPLVRRL